MRHAAIFALVLAALAVLPGCDSGSGAVGLTGTWEGEVTVDSGASAGRYGITMRLSDDGRTVSGTGTVGSENGDERFAISGGSFAGTSVTLPLTFASDPIPGSLTGALVNQDPGRISGSFSGPSNLVGDVQIELVAR